MKLFVIWAGVLVAGCVANRTTIQSTWADDQYAGPPLDRVAVVAMFETRADSLAFEREAAEYLAAQGVETVAAHEVLAPAETQRLDEAEVRERLEPADVDGVLIFRLVAVDERREYQVPTPYLLNGPPEHTSVNGSSWYDRTSSSYYWYSSSPQDTAGSSGYWIEQTFVVAETALFDNRSDRLLWTAKSETMDDAHFERTSESIVRSVARQLLAMELLARAAAARGG
jgi:hypothetical protein